MSMSARFVMPAAVPRFLKSLTLGLGLAATLALLPTPANALSNEFRHLLNSIGRDIVGNQSGKFCEPQLFAEVGTSLTHVTRGLKDLVSSGDSSEKHERYEGVIEPHTAVAGGVQATRCKGTFSALWVIKPGTQADAGFIRITANVTSCPCATASELKLGYMQFTVPVTRSRAFDDSESFTAGNARDFVIEAECCNGRKTSRTGAQDAPATAVAPPRTAVATPQAATPQPPRTSPPPPPPPPPPPAPPKPVEKPAWSMANPCPPCQNWKDYLDRTLAEIAALEKERQALAEELGTLERAIGDRQKQIEDLRTRIRLQEGTGGSASDYPQPGWKTESVTQADGRVKITVTDASGRVVEESYRERKDLAKLRQQIDELEAASTRDRARQEQIRQRIASLESAITAKNKQAEAYRSGLADCIREQCGVAVSEDLPAVAVPAPAMVPTTPATPTPPTMPATSAPLVTPAPQTDKPAKTDTSPPAKTGCGFSPSQPMTVGPRSEVGSGAERAAKKAAGGFLGGLVSQATGGMLSTGGGGEAEAPPVVENPVPETNRRIFKVNDDLEIEVGMAWTKDGLLISHELVKSPDKGTFHAAAMQRPDCSWALPDDYMWYKLWLEWSLSVSWTRDHYVDGKHVKHEEGGWTESGTRDIASGVLGTSADAPSAESKLAGAMPIWQRAGFSGATGGIQGMGTVYGLTPEDLEKTGMKNPVHFVLHIADPRVDPVRTIPLDFVLIDKSLVQGDAAKPRIPVLGDTEWMRGLLKTAGSERENKELMLMLPKIGPARYRERY